MKRLLFWLMLITGVFTVLAGILESQSWHTDKPGAHIGTAIVFAVLCVFHIIIQWKAVLRNITGAAKLPQDPKQKRRMIIRRINIFIMLIAGPLTLISAIAESHPGHGHGLPVFHIVTASIFIFFFARHTLVNRKAVWRYITGEKKETAPAPISNIEDAAE